MCHPHLWRRPYLIVRILWKRILLDCKVSDLLSWNQLKIMSKEGCSHGYLSKKKWWDCIISSVVFSDLAVGEVEKGTHCRYLCYSLGPEFCSLRYGLALIMHFSNFTMITQRVSLSIAIIAMVNSTQQPGLFNTSTERPLAFTFNHSNRSIKEFNTAEVSIVENKALCWEGKLNLKRGLGSWFCGV